MNIIKNMITSVVVSLVVAAIALFVPFSSAMAVYTPKAAVSLTFDDGFQSSYTNAAPILDAYNLPATIYVSSGYIDGTVALDDNLPAMTWEQVISLKEDYGWEIGNHTDTHPELPTITIAQMEEQITNSQAAFAMHGLTPTNFATPFGAYDNNVLATFLKEFESHRGFADRDTLNSFPYSRAIIQVQDVNNTTTVAQVQAWVDQAKANNQWLVLVFHHVAPTLPTYEYTTTDATLTQIADYLVTSGVEVKTVDKVLSDRGVSIVDNKDFANDMGTWTTSSAQVTLDTANNGAYSDTKNTNSIKMVGNSAASHLFSGLISVVPGANYFFESFYNTMNLTAGELGFYMDEYDANGNWISGQWLGMVANNSIGYFSKLYNATSNLVSKVRLQTYVTANSSGTAYVDNVDLYNADATASATPTITVTPTATPSVTPSGTPSATPSVTPTANMIANGNFDAGVTNGWTTDRATQVTADAGTVKMTGATTAAHLFYSFVTVDPTANYLLQAVANTTGLTSGELGFYMDEYDAGGTWISGQWLGMVANGALTTYNRVYKATSNLVSQIRIQTYLTANSAGTATVDDYSLVNQSVTPTVAPTIDPSVTPSVTPSETLSATPSVTVTPSVTPSTTPAPTGNLVTNGGFEDALTGWTTDSTNVAIDSASNGDAGVNSVSLTPNTAYAHLFSSQIAVDQASIYTWSQYVKATGAGEFGFYIDEYDANGNWISGQWKGMINAAFTGVKTFSYTPTSNLVAKVRLQYYATPASTFTLFLDSVSLSK